MKPSKSLQWPVLAFVCMLLLPGNAYAAEKTDFSGKRVLNESKSDLGEGRFFSAAKMSVAREGNTMTIKSEVEFNRQGETIQMTRTEVWSLGQDGKTLKIQSDSSSAMGDRSVTLVYDRE